MGEEQTLRSGEIIRRLRDFLAKREVEMRAESLDHTVREAVDLVLFGAAQFEIRLSYRLDPAADRIFADRIQVQQVLVNLLRNAVDALRNQPAETREIVIETRARRWRHGRSLGGGQRPGPARGGQGSALFPLRHHQERQRDGDRPVDLAAHRRGAWRNAGGREPAERGGDLSLHAAGAGGTAGMTKCIYLVDDDDAVRASLHSLLSLRSDLAVRSFRSGDAFLNDAAELDSGVLLLDFHMPGSSGVDVLHAIRERLAGKFAAVILTGEGNVALAVAGDEDGRARLRREAL